MMRQLQKELEKVFVRKGCVIGGRLTRRWVENNGHVDLALRIIAATDIESDTFGDHVKLIRAGRTRPPICAIDGCENTTGWSSSKFRFSVYCCAKCAKIGRNKADINSRFFEPRESTRPSIHEHKERSEQH